MVNVWVKISIAAAAIVSVAVSAAGGTPADAGAYSALSSGISGYAKNSGIKRIVVADFSAGSGAGAAEADYISRRLSASLAGSGIGEVADRDHVKRLLREVRLSSSSASPYREALRRELMSVDAVVSGIVYGAGGKSKVLVRLLDARKGNVLFSAETELARERSEVEAGAGPGVSAPSGGVYLLTAELPGILVPDLPKARAAVAAGRPSDLRDAVAGAGDRTCAGRSARLAWRNEVLVDAKARYWAAKMKEPGGVALGARPGSEIRDPGVKADFYRLLAEYYKDASAAPPGAAQLGKLEKLRGEEAEFLSECGAR